MMTGDSGLMQVDQKLASPLTILRRRRRQFLIPLCTLPVVAVLVAFLWPPVYRSVATILIEQQEVPVELIPTTVTSFADQRLHVIGQRVMTSANLLSIIRKFDLYPDDTDEAPEVLVEMMQEDISVDVVSADVVDPRNGRPTQATIAFNVAYEHELPDLAYRVASELTSLYLNENVKSRIQTVEDTTEFLSQEAGRLGREVLELEQKVATFKEDNITRLPELTDLNLRFLDRIEHDRAQVEEEIRSTEQRRIYLQAMLAGLAQEAPLPNSQQLMTPAERQRLLEASLVSMAAIYGPEHPDLQRVKRELAALQGETGSAAPVAVSSELAARESELAAARQQYAPDHPDVQRLERTVAELQAAAAQSSTDAIAAAAADAATPSAGTSAVAALPRSDASYVQLYGQLQAATAESAALAAKKKDIEAQYAELQKRLEESPRIESDYRGMMREYDATSARYQEIKAKLAEAQLAEALESGRKGERFTVIDPALRPEEPVSPNRWAILIVGFIIAIAAAVGSVAAAENLDESVRGFELVSTLVGQAPLAVIPVITTVAESAARSLRRRLIAGGATVAVAISAVLVHLLVMPLGTVWLLALKRFGL
jgi:uncharacterized protein involved in exopolysaccharide biosynthesis